LVVKTSDSGSGGDSAAASGSGGKAYEWTVEELEHTAKALGYAAVK
ncbi:hypothetical protein Tco_0957661, partial [Tanacetum coccineum]